MTVVSSGVPRTTTRAQLAALLSLRWSMIRRPGVRAALLLLATTVLGLVALAAVAGPGMPATLRDQSEALLPSALLGFLMLCAIAPVAAGGGFELVPADQLVAFPVRHRTVTAASLLLVPLNVAWVALVIALVATTTAAFGRGGPPTGALVTLTVFVVTATITGHALAWVVVGLRRRRSGRLLVWGAVAVSGIALAGVVLLDRTEDVLLGLPTTTVSDLMAAWPADPVHAALGTAVVLLSALVAWSVGVMACGWALRRTGDVAGTDPAARPVRRIRDDGDLPRMLRRNERNGVLRSAPLRRGLAVIVLLPAAAAVIARLPWDSLVLLPPLVGSGAALLYGVNAFALEGSGAMLFASSPLPHRAWLAAKARVVLEVVGLAVVAAVVAGSARAGVPTLLDVTAVACSALSCTLLVVASCLHLSVTRPHRAELRGPRDTPAPPGTMALYSVRLATMTTLVGLGFALSSISRSWPALLLMSAATILLAARSWLRTRRRWDDPAVRARVVATVSTG